MGRAFSDCEGADLAEEYLSRKVLETDRCVLMPFQKHDYDEVKQLYMNLEVRRYLGGVRKEEELPRIFNEMCHTRDEDHWVVRNKDSNGLVGVISLGPHHDGSFHEISYQLLPEWWGNGYGLEAVRAILDYAFGVLHLPKVIAETQTSNLPSRKLLERAGMQEEQRLMRFGAEQIIFALERI